MATSILIPAPTLDLSPYDCGCCGPTSVCCLLTHGPLAGSYLYPWIVFRRVMTPGSGMTAGMFFAVNTWGFLQLTPAGGGTYTAEYFESGQTWSAPGPVSIPDSVTLTCATPPANRPGTMRLALSDAAVTSCCNLYTSDTCQLTVDDLPASVTVSSNDADVVWQDPVVLPFTSAYGASDNYCWTAVYRLEELYATCTLTDPFGFYPSTTFDVYKTTQVEWVAAIGDGCYVGSMHVIFNLVAVRQPGEPLGPMALYMASGTSGYGNFGRGGTVYGSCESLGGSIPVGGSGPYGYFADAICCPTRIPTNSCPGLFGGMSTATVTV